jgi:hypothetical protein
MLYPPQLPFASQPYPTSTRYHHPELSESGRYPTTLRFIGCIEENPNCVNRELWMLLSTPHLFWRDAERFFLPVTNRKGRVDGVSTASYYYVVVVFLVHV